MNFRMKSCAAACAIVLSGCGGGGSTTMPDGMGPAEPMQGGMEGDLSSALAGSRQTLIQTATAAAARSTPRQGSVTQSSNAATGGVTTDRVVAAATRSDNRITYSLTGTIGGQPLDFEGSGDASSEGLSQAMISRPAGSGTLHVGIRTNIAEGGDTDWLAGGIWVYLPDDVSDTGAVSFGAFANGGDPFPQDNIAGLTGTARYQGDAAGVYLNPNPEGGPEGGPSLFNARTTLTVDFGDGATLGTIGGTIHSVTEEDGTPFLPSPTLTLESADIGDSGSGFFTGDTSMTYGDDGAGRAFSGKWGGQFFGEDAAADAPISVVGTFGAATDDGDGFVGAYVANKEEDAP